MSIPSSLAFSDDRKEALAAEPAKMVITVGAEGTPGADQRVVTVQVQDANGAPLKRKTWVDLVAWATTGQAALTSASTGLAVASGTISIAAWTAGKALRVLSDVNGFVNLTYTDIGTATCMVEAVCGAARGVSSQFANA